MFKIFILIRCAKILFPNKVTLVSSRDKDC